MGESVVALTEYNSERFQTPAVEQPVLSAPVESSRAVRPAVFLMTDSFQTGGSERQFVALARALDSSTYDVRLGCLQEKGPLAQNLGSVKQFDLGGSLYRWQSMKARYRLVRYLRQSSTAIAHAFDFYTNLVLIPAARLAGTAVIIGSQRQLGDLLTPAQRRAQAAIFRLADCVVCNSYAACKPLIDGGFPRQKLRVIGNGLDPSAFATSAVVCARASGSFRVGMIARMNTLAKNHQVLLRVANRLKNQFRGFELILIGDGPLRPELEAYAQQLGVRDSVQFVGERMDIPAILAGLDVTVLPSGSESLSNAILESMAAGVPVVANAVGGNVELINEERGVLVPSGNEEALERALLRLAGDPSLRLNLARNAKKFAEDNFTIQRMRTSYEELYAELLERKRWHRKHVSMNGRHLHRGRRWQVKIIAPSLRYVGGQSVQAGLLVRHWQDDADIQADFLAVDPSFPLGLKWAEKIPFLRTIVRQPLYLSGLWRSMKHADVAHIFSASYWSFLLAPLPAWFIARLRGKKVLLHYHSGEARDHLQRSRVARSIIRKTDLLIVPSDYLVNVFAEFGLKAEAIPNILDLSQFRFRVRTPLRPHLVCTRGFHPYYRIDLVVRAFAELQKEIPEATLDLAGVGPIEGEIRELVKELNVPSVNFLGAISRQDIGRVYDAADIFVNASSLDNMPVSVLEAFACGTPVVTTAPEGMDYLVQHERTGLLSPTGDALALAKNLLRLLRDEGLSARLAANAHAESRRYEWSTVRDLWLDAYRSLVPETHQLENT